MKRKITKSTFMPLSIALAGKTVVFIGGGEVVYRKWTHFSGRGAQLIIAAPQLCDKLEEALRLDSEAFLHRVERYSPEVLEGADLVYIGTNDVAVNEQAFQDAKQRKIWCGRADESALSTRGSEGQHSDWMGMALIEKGSFQIGISTGGRSPAGVTALKTKIEAALDLDHIEIYLELMAALKKRLKEEEPDQVKRAAYLRQASQYTIENLERLLKDETFYSRFKG